MEIWGGTGTLQRSRVYPRSLALDYARVADDAAQLEAMGFDAFSASEHHFTYDGFCPSPLVALAAAARATSRIKLVTGALLLPLHDPLRVAEDAATLDALSGGRVILGLGMGYRPTEFDGMAADKRTRGARLIEMMQVIRAALSSERFSFAGRHYQYDNAAVYPRPVQRPHPPLWLCGGTTARAAGRAGTAGLPYWLANSTFEHAATCVAEYRRAGAAAGVPGPDLKVAVFKDFCLAGRKADALAQRDVLLRDFYDEHILGFGYLVDEDGRHVYDPPRDHPLYRRFVESIFVGTPEDAVTEMRRYETLGVDAMYVATMQKELFMTEVLPAVRRR
jgi:alkanesulfonate monooxygenase SsuD/methylene tetrahydromethanopterin reductase-like flavin-dependent oxidoreductase (luciferase family)